LYYQINIHQLGLLPDDADLVMALMLDIVSVDEPLLVAVTVLVAVAAAVLMMFSELVPVVDLYDDHGVVVCAFPVVAVIQRNCSIQTV
jgi:hypothetical protein